MTAGLSDYLRAAAARPFAWGSHDCCLFAADWVALSTGIDPAASFRGRYDGEAGALRFVARAGGLVALMAPHMAPFGETADVRPGDVGAVAVGLNRLVAIRSTTGWACLALRGLVVTPATLLRGWSLCLRS